MVLPAPDAGAVVGLQRCPQPPGAVLLTGRLSATAPHFGSTSGRQSTPPPSPDVA
jgi:hypothetical protein